VDTPMVALSLGHCTVTPSSRCDLADGSLATGSVLADR
jgi:hypothetical protein